MADLIGQDVGRYHIIEQLGKGGMAIVYKAFDTRLEREVAIKFIRTERIPPDELKKMLIRFEREGKALARMEHASIIRIHDYGDHEGTPYLVMNYLPGGTLKDYSRRPMDYKDAVKLLLPVAHALAYAHELGVVHRDVKPANILISRRGEPMLSDFGIARILETESGTLTGTGVGIGTPEYMAPEQCRGEVSPAVDIYALGVVLYELITGKPPYQADTPLAVMIKQSRDPLPRPSSFVADLPVEVEQVLYKALAKEPEDRYVSMMDLISAMEKLLQLKENDIPAFSLPSKKDSSVAAGLKTENESIQQPDAACAEAGKPVLIQTGATPTPVETLESALPDETVSERGKAITGDKLDAATEETFFPETMDIPGDHFQTIVDAPPEPDLSTMTEDFRQMDFETKGVAATAPVHLMRDLPPVEEARSRAGQQAVKPATPSVIPGKSGMDKTWLMGGAAALGGLLLICVICIILFGLGAGGMGPLAGLFGSPSPTQAAKTPAVEPSETAVKMVNPTPYPNTKIPTAAPTQAITATLQPVEIKPLSITAKDLNYTAEDLGAGYTMMEESDGVESLGLDATAPINSANMRAFATEDLQIVTSVVMNIKTVKDAEDAFGEKGLVGNITGQLESSIPDAQFKELTGYKFGDKTIMFSGEDATMGKLYLVVFRKVNIVSVVFIIGSNMTQESAVQIVKKLEAKIR